MVVALPRFVRGGRFERDRQNHGGGRSDGGAALGFERTMAAFTFDFELYVGAPAPRVVPDHMGSDHSD